MSVGVVQIYTENFNGYDLAWYMNMGSSLCIAQLISIFSTKLSELGIMTIRLTRQCIDRKCWLKAYTIGADGQKVPNS